MELNEVRGESFTDAMEAAFVIDSNHVHLDDWSDEEKPGAQTRSGPRSDCLFRPSTADFSAIPRSMVVRGIPETTYDNT